MKVLEAVLEEFQVLKLCLHRHTTSESSSLSVCCPSEVPIGATVCKAGVSYLRRGDLEGEVQPWGWGGRVGGWGDGGGGVTA